jgi:hypothetical protein
MKKLLVVLLVVAALVITLSFNASAACQASGKVTYVQSYSSVTYFFITPNTSGVSPAAIPYWTYFAVPLASTYLRETAMAATVSGKTATFYGSGTCTAATGLRNGGTVTRVDILGGL